MAASARLRQSKGAACARACATPSPTASCIDCHEALQLRIKRTKAGGGLVAAKGAGAVKWESDSDSDENNSDNEEDLMV